MGHQGKLAARYVLRAASAERIGLMFEKGKNSKAYLWVGLRFAHVLMDADIDVRVHPAASLFAEVEPDGKRPNGRHAALRSMRDLSNADLAQFTIAKWNVSTTLRQRGFEFRLGLPPCSSAG